MENSQVFIKGYKVDPDKLSKKYGNRKDDPQNTRFLSIWKKFPLPYLYLATSEAPEGHVSLVVVLADGINREEVEQKPMPVISPPYTAVFTPGVWKRYS